MSVQGDHGSPDGRLIAGRYRVTGTLGRGGMGMVSRAVDEVLHREVAVKELRAYNDASESELAELRLRMEREARAAARIRHPGVIAVHDVAEEGGRPVIVMELVDGPSLDDVLRGGALLDPCEAAAIGAKVAGALGAAHAAGVLHRDVKPGNVLLERGGRVVLTDFGIAAMEDPDDGSASQLTSSGQVVGSLDFLAPERAQGERPGPASDIWSLGALLFAAVEGGSPFRRTSAWSTMAAIVTEPLPEPRRAGPLAPVLQALLAKDPAGRPDAEQAVLLLEGVARGGAERGGAAGGADPGREQAGAAQQEAPATAELTAPQPGPRPVPPQSDPLPAAAAQVFPSPAAGDPAQPPAAGAEPRGWRPPSASGAAGVSGAAGGGGPAPRSGADPAAEAPGRARRRTAAIAAAAAVVVVGAGLTWIAMTPGASTGQAGAAPPGPYLSGPDLPSASGSAADPVPTGAGKTGLADPGSSVPGAAASGGPSSAGATGAAPGAGRSGAGPSAAGGTAPAGSTAAPLPAPTDQGYIPGSLATTDGCEAWLDYRPSSSSTTQGGQAMATVLSTGAPCEMHFFRKYTPSATSSQNLDSYHSLTSASQVSTYWYWDGPGYYAGVCVWRTDRSDAPHCGGRYYVATNGRPQAE